MWVFRYRTVYVAVLQLQQRMQFFLSEFDAVLMEQVISFFKKIYSTFDADISEDRKIAITLVLCLYFSNLNLTLISNHNISSEKLTQNKNKMTCANQAIGATNRSNDQQQQKKPVKF